MTTQRAAELYLAQHRYSLDGRGWAVFNPHGKPIEELPVIYGFNNGGSPGWYSAIALSEDGTCLGGHCCSHECYMEHDLGITEGSRLDRHTDDYQKHYPNGYRMEFISSENIKTHAGLTRALEAANAKPDQEPHND